METESLKLKLIVVERIDPNEISFGCVLPHSKTTVN